MAMTTTEPISSGIQYASTMGMEMEAMAPTTRISRAMPWIRWKILRSNMSRYSVRCTMALMIQPPIMAKGNSGSE